MPTQDGDDEGRRAFLRDAARYAALGALGLMAAAFVRRQGPLDAEGKCTIAQACRKCPVYERCRLPQAEQSRQPFGRS